MQKNSILWETPRNGLILLASSWVIAYAGYVFVLQTPYFFSRARLAYGIFAWILLLLALYALQVKTGPVYALPGRKFPIGVAGLFLFLNLLWVALFHRIPYTFMWMPSQRVTIAPLSADAEIEIKQFVIENGGYQGINQFAVHEGWLDRINGFFRQSGDEGDLLWGG